MAYNRTPEAPEVAASNKAKVVANYIVVLFGNFCAISAIYFAVRTNFVMPMAGRVFLMFIIAWVIVSLLTHMLLKPFLEKRFFKKLNTENN